jgi:hypothetical protein
MASTGLNSSVRAADASAVRADIAVALASYNHARTIGPVVRAVCDGLASHFGSSVMQIVLVDGGSTDGTREAARAAVGATELVEVEYSPMASLADVPYHGFPGRANALRAILEAIQRMSVRAVALVDAGLETADSQRIANVVAAILTDQFDYVSSYYVRSRFDGLITKGIVAPLFRALYGAMLRQPAAVEFGCSARMADHFLQQDVWDREGAQAGIDLWLATEAVCGGFRVCEAALGVRGTVHHETTDLSTTLAQVVGSLFADLEHRADVWQRVRQSVAVPLVGAVSGPEPEAAAPNVERLIEPFRLGYRELREIWTWILPPKTIIALRRLAETPSDRFRFDDLLWASILYDFALGYSLRVMPRDHLLRSLTPIYSGWMASIVRQMHDATDAQVEDRLEQVCAAFDAQKRYLISRWRWPERVRR